MPQTHRKVAFSNKKKKAQLKARRERKKLIESGEDPKTKMTFHQTSSAFGEVVDTEEGGSGAVGEAEINFLEEVEAINQQPKGQRNANRYNLKFKKENESEKARKRTAHHTQIQSQPSTVLEAGSEVFYPPGLGYPSRPPWTKNMSKQELDMSENRHFRIFCQNLDQKFGGDDMSLYELNLETWRQLWRVTEMADILLIICDARFPVAQFPPYLYDHLVKQDKKGIVLVLNKCDLVGVEVVAAWHHYFSTHYPDLILVPFSSWEDHSRRSHKIKMAKNSALKLVEACQSLVRDAVNLQSWKSKIEEEGIMSNEECIVQETINLEAQSTHPFHHERFKDGVLTIGTIGHPNVGKSSLINALMGKKVVSVSKTPGHTKHFQTIFLTKTVRLCDCPGLVFPSTVSRPLQVVTGSYPIAQVRDPISVVQYIGARIDIPSILKLQHPSHSDFHDTKPKWTAYFICEAWATKRGYFTRARGGPDVSRAANELLRLCLNAQKGLVLYLRPPQFTTDKEKYESDPLTEEVKLIQGIHAKDTDSFALNKEEREGNGADCIEDDDDETESEEASEYESEEEEHCASTKNKFALLSENN